ncbi:glutamate receptor 2.1 [Medicago truncatula]|uniref:glutamate receptor 2.1 n=1 Tax=Medicago truncatula TaxID=3880 RepID=UPI000D2F40E5|nr:glutamate receptor 2.1 [Medicago truncatula]
MSPCIAAEEMINVQKVQVIIGMHTWPEAAIMEDIGSKAQVPIISFAAPTITPPLMNNRWPFLTGIHNIIYKDDGYGGDYGMLTLLGEALQDVDSMIEHCLILPLISSLHDPGELISKEMIKLTQTQSRVFIVLQSSLEMEIHVFKEASKVGLVDKESVWMIPESIANLLDSVNKSAISYMEGALGIKTYYSERSREYKEFKAQFQRTFWSKNPEEDNRYPGFYALQAYDSINIVTQAFNRMTSRNNSSPKFLLSEIQSSNFIGLSGHIQLEAGQVMQKNLVLRIVNVAGKSYKELCFWTEQHGFTTINHAGQGGNKVTGKTECFRGVHWPGNLDRGPKG